MNILIISQCTKKALKETRRIVDQFAERTGDRAWQTQITAEGLKTLHRLLRKTARKNTAVACFWNRGRHLTELIWIVGDKSQFNEDGRTPTNRTQRDILRLKDENQWNYLSSIQIMSVLAALLHDIGKATVGFDAKLRDQTPRSDPYRHEWISLCLFKKMIEGCQNNKEFLERLRNWDIYIKSNINWHQELVIDEEHKQSLTFEFEDIPPLAQWLAWLIVSHHRLPFYDVKYRCMSTRKLLRKDDSSYLLHDVKSFFKSLKPVENWVKHQIAIDESGKNLGSFFNLKKDPTNSDLWIKDLQRWSRKALNDDYLMSLTNSNALWNPLHLHLSRLCLMIGDHNYSSLSSDSPKRILNQEKFNTYFQIAKEDKTSKTKLWANFDRNTGYGKQFLDEHLVGVARMTASFNRYLPFIRHELNSLNNHSRFRKRATVQRFAWQDKACDLVKAFSETSEKSGFFGVNIASTGTGKTLANAKIMTALAGDKKGSRLTFALGLRVLTSQTGQSLREHFDLDEATIATLIGGTIFPASTEVIKNQDAQSGSESAASDLFFDNGEFFDLIDEGGIDEDIFGTVIHDPKTKQLLMTPWISCTIDHLMQLTEQHRGGRYMAPLLRVLSSDLILDEPDDFGTNDLPALSRLIYWAGLLGSRVMLSSATITKDMAIGLHAAYESGRKIWNRFVDLPEQPTVCAWFDEFNQHIRQTDNIGFTEYHQKFCEKRIKKISEQPIRRKADWLEFKSKSELSCKLMEGVLTLHTTNAQTYQDLSGRYKKISVGLIRFANINPMMEVLQDFLNEECPKDTVIHVVPYHSQQLLLFRSNLESILDRLLNRKSPDNLIKHAEIQTAINTTSDDIKNHIFIVFGSPVTEVGRDHDYDWAIIEPSSMRSIIQLVGRVWRHRPDKIAYEENVLILNQNLKAERGARIAYTRPGYETDEFPLRNHNLVQIIDKSEIENINSIPRLLREKIKKETKTTAAKKVVARKQASIMRGRIAQNQNISDASFLQEKNGLASLEHRVMKDLLNNQNNFLSLYRQENNAATLTSHHSRISPFRESSGFEETYVALLRNGYQNDLLLKSYQNAKNNPDDDEKSAMHHFDLVEIKDTEQIKLWLKPCFASCLQTLSEELGIDEGKVALRFATVNLRNYQDVYRWKFNPWGGFWSGGAT